MFLIREFGASEEQSSLLLEDLDFTKPLVQLGEEVRKFHQKKEKQLNVRKRRKMGTALFAQARPAGSVGEGSGGICGWKAQKNLGFEVTARRLTL